jgi:sugar/nucleoside kinase (ribokinase family)
VTTSPFVVTGYVGLDHVVEVNRAIEPGVTSLVTRRYTPEAGRLGGCAANIALGLAAAGLEVEVVTWVGDDAAADDVVITLERTGVGAEGVERAALERTGISWLPQATAGPSYCVYDPGGPAPTSLNPVQLRLVSAAQWCVFAVGPPEPTDSALAALRQDAFLLWAVKADPASFPLPLMQRLAVRADAFVFSDEEGDFLADGLGARWQTQIARPSALIVESKGAEGLRWRQGTAGGRIAGEALSVADTIGAGDWLCAGILAALSRGLVTDDALRAAIAHADSFLRRRSADELATQHTPREGG